MNDDERVAALLGRPPRGDYEVVVRDVSGDPVVIRNAYRVHVAILSPAHAGLITENLSASGHLKLSIARNTVLAISTGP